MQVVCIRVCEEEVTTHATEQQRLLDVFLAEIRVGGLRAVYQRPHARDQRATYLDDVEELGDDCRDASEKVGSARAFHLMPVPLDLDERPPLEGDVLVYPRGIHVLHAGQKHGRGRADDARDGHLLFRQLREILGERARVGAEVFVRCKLSWIDKDGDHRQVVFVKRSADCVLDVCERIGEGSDVGWG